MRWLPRQEEGFKFNTSISAFMEYLNAVTVNGEIREMDSECCEIFMRATAPFAPHFAEEIWHAVLGRNDSVHAQPWPSYDRELIKEEEVEIPVQINGKLRGRITVSSDADEETVKARALEDERVKRSLEGKTIRKVIFAGGRLINIVAK